MVYYESPDLLKTTSQMFLREPQRPVVVPTIVRGPTGHRGCADLKLDGSEPVHAAGHRRERLHQARLLPAVGLTINAIKLGQHSLKGIVHGLFFSWRVIHG